MPKKRKASSNTAELPANRPRTRSSVPLNVDHLLSTQSHVVAKENGKSNPLSSLGSRSDDDLNFLGPSPSNTKNVSRSEGPSDDDMNLLGSSSSQEETTSNRTQRQSLATKGMTRKPDKIVEVFISPREWSHNARAIGGFSAAGSPSPLNSASKGGKIATHPGASPISSHSPPPPSFLPPLEHSSSQRLPETLPAHLQPYFQAQRVAVLQALQRPPLFVDDDKSASSAFSQLNELLNGTIQRSEGNSCLVLGPRGSGKSRLVDRVLESLPSTSTASPLVVRLSAQCQTNDRLAMREIARQIQRQVDPDFTLPTLPSGVKEQETFLEANDGRPDVDLPPPSHLPTLVSALPALGRPVVVVLEAFDGFAAHARQALLYCLLDTVQSCRGGAPMAAVKDGITNDRSDQVEGDITPSHIDQAIERSEAGASREVVKGEHGLLVIGVTSRVDCLTLLEKRVKSRFSHRVMRVKTLAGLDDFLSFARSILCVGAHSQGAMYEEWRNLWVVSVEKFLAEKEVRNVFSEAFALVKDLRMLCRLLVSPVVALTSRSPWLTATHMLSSVCIQRPSSRFPFLCELPYPHIALLIAAVHTQTSGHDTFNFEMLFDAFLKQVRTSAAAPVQIAGSAIGMVKIPRNVVMGAFEQLVATRVFQPVAAPALHVTREFVKYRCVADRTEIKAAVEHLGQTNLKKWFYKGQ